MTYIKVAILNESTVVSEKDVSTAIPALQKQITGDFAPHWGITAELVAVHKGKQPPANAWQLIILDNADQADALGYHDLTAGGLPLMKVFAQTAREDAVSWTSVASHELLEALADPYVDSTVFVQTSDDSGRLWPMEVCDPVQGDLYKIGATEVSNFVTPYWFILHSTASTFDYLKLTSQPFEVRHTGYAQYFEVPHGSGWKQINEDHRNRLGE